MTQTQKPNPPDKLWEALPQIVNKLSNEFLLVTLGILILVIAIGAFVPDVVESLGRGFFYLIVVLAWLAYLSVRVLDAWVKLRTASPPTTEPAAQPAERLEDDMREEESTASPAAPDQHGQTVHGSQTNIGQSQGPVLSGVFHDKVTVEATPPPPSQAPGAAPPGLDASEFDRLHHVLHTRFDQEELRTLCFIRLGVNYQDLGGEGHSAKARELVLYMSRRMGGLERLRAAIEAERPGALG